MCCVASECGEATQAGPCGARGFNTIVRNLHRDCEDAPCIATMHGAAPVDVVGFVGLGQMGMPIALNLLKGWLCACAAGVRGTATRCAPLANSM